jgi:protoporphyrinogen oxidase
VVRKTIILGAGMSGLGAALSSGLPVYEGASRPGGVCHSYYRAPDGSLRDPQSEAVSECFRFEPAGGHWLFGVSKAALDRLSQYCGFRKYARRAATFFPDSGRCIPYPLQENLRYFEPQLRDQILAELSSPERCTGRDPPSFKDWLLMSFGRSLCEQFFFPFNERYTSGYFEHIAPQDLYKSPIDRARVLQGALQQAPDHGYNSEFYYPDAGLDMFIRAVSSECQIHLGHRVTHIDTSRRVIGFSQGASVPYDSIISTIPLNKMAFICGVSCGIPPDPATAVLVVNMAARRGVNCPPYHWVYVPSAKSGIHRVGFYSNVDRSFLPARYRDSDDIVSVYAERSFVAGSQPVHAELARAASAIVDELKEWRFIDDVLIVDPTFTDPAYTWSWRRSEWVQEMIHLLANQGIQQVGRYGAWKFQGMMASFEEGIAAGKSCGV